MLSQISLLSLLLAFGDFHAITTTAMTTTTTTTTTTALQPSISRRSIVAASVGFLTASTICSDNLEGLQAADLNFQTSKSTGLQYADAKIGTGQPMKLGSYATIDYVLSTTGARYGSKIYGTADKDAAYRWTLGDGSTIEGIEKAILGDADLPPMLPGGIRRVIIPQVLGYGKLAENPKALCAQGGQPGPIPPPNTAFEEYQRFKNIYCNPERQYQPDIVMDIKLYGSRSR